VNIGKHVLLQRGQKRVGEIDLRTLAQKENGKTSRKAKVRQKSG
jgi:hypothetical protein